MLIRLTSHDLPGTVLFFPPVFASHKYKADRFMFTQHFAEQVVSSKNTYKVAG